jgi:hypothetical protein
MAEHASAKSAFARKAQVDRHPTRILGKHFVELPLATIIGER